MEGNESRVLRFEKDEKNEWYVVLPEWTGPKADLQMVCGADTFLDMIAQGEAEASMSVSLSPVNGFKFVLDKKQDTPDIGGALYYISSFYDQDFEMWLCDVTRFVFGGELPSTIYVN